MASTTEYVTGQCFCMLVLGKLDKAKGILLVQGLPCAEMTAECAIHSQLISLSSHRCWKRKTVDDSLRTKRSHGLDAWD